MHTQTNRVSGAPVAAIDGPLAEAVRALQGAAEVNAVLVEAFGPGQWLPPRPEPPQFRRPTIVIALCDEAHAGENVLHVGDDIRMVANGVFESAQPVSLSNGSVLVCALGEDGKMALAASER